MNWLVSGAMTQPTDFGPSRSRRWPTYGRLRRGGVFSVAVGALIVGFQSFADADSPERYPYDPVCPWGRVADGNGMLVRCLQTTEAKQLLQIQPPAVTAVSPAPPVSPVHAPATSATAAPEKRSTTSVIVDSVGPAVADAGDLPVAGKQLGLGSAKEKYVQCVNQHGGLSAKQAKVVVRFLVRERGRAEGVGVKSHAGLSLAAAQCIADVVNLRYVGYPAAPIVGATIPIVLSAQP